MNRSHQFVVYSQIEYKATVPHVVSDPSAILQLTTTNKP